MKQALSLIGVSFLSVVSSLAADKKPNIILILADDMRASGMNFLGKEQVQTPNLDKLAGESTVFTNAHIMGGTSGAVSMPSRAMLMTGKYLYNLEKQGATIPNSHTMIGETLQKAGYNTFHTGKWHSSYEALNRCFKEGKAIFFGGMWDHWNVPVNDYHADGKYTHEIDFTPNFTANETPVKVRAEKINAGVHSSELFADAAADYIRGYNDDAPFFMYLSFLAPHDPRTMPEKYRNMYDPEKISLPPNYAAMPAVSFDWPAKGRDENTEVYPRRPERIKQHIADYYAMISHLDDCIGRVLDALRERGMLDDTVIVMCGDNGLAIGQHGLMGKQNVYEHSVCVPLLISGPGIPAGRVDENYVYLLDIFPTLCELLDIPVPASVDGKSFAGVIRGDGKAPRESLYLAFQARIRGVIAGKYKLIEYRSENLKLTQLFDLEADPWERDNLFDAPGYDGITAELRRELFRLRDEWEDEKNEFVRLYWEQWRRYEDAALHGVPGPKGASMSAQVGSWGTELKK